ncbi:MAG: hypothetical protein ACHQNA_02830 [Acidimicrobiales bacterium]
MREQRAYLDRLRRHHLDLVARFLGASEGDLYTIDLFLSGVATRSFRVVDGFLAVLDDWNIVSAAPLLRLQLDNLTRVSYVVHAPRADEVVDELLLRNVEFRRMRAPDGERLLDWKLVQLATDFHPWLPPVYEATSGWVHLSPLLARMGWHTESTDLGEHVLAGRFPLTPEDIPVSALEELLGAMTKATEELFGYFEVWEARKGLPLGQTRPLGDREEPEGNP